MWLDTTALEDRHVRAEPRAARYGSPDAPHGKTRSSTDLTLEKLYRDEAPALRLYVKRLVRDAGIAEDIVQDSFLRLWRALGGDAVKSPRAVLFTTARNLGLNHLRNARVRNSEVARAACADAFFSVLPTAEEQMICGEDAAASRDLLAMLPVRCREALVLRVIEEMSYKEMAKQMRLSISTIEKHVGKGKQLFKRHAMDADARCRPAQSVSASARPLPAYAIAAE
jgi:RNA polymerase sigma-70 factor (ECF subfamily)